MKPCVDARLRIVCEKDQTGCCRSEGGTDPADPFHIGTCDEDHGGTDDKEDDRCGHMLFECDRSANEDDDAGGAKKTVFEVLCFLLEFGYVKSHHQHEREFHDVRGLEFYDFQVDPTSRTFMAHADAGDENEQKQEIADRKNDGGCFFQKTVVDEGHYDHGDDTDGYPEKLFFDEVEAITHLGAGKDIACRRDHDGTVADEKHDDNEKDSVNSSAYAVNGISVRSKKGVQNFEEEILLLRGWRRCVSASGSWSIRRVGHTCTSFRLYG